MSYEFDYVLVGGGLQNGLIALALLAHRPAVRLAMIERQRALGGNHTWCFYARDVPPSAAPWLEPLVSARWHAYQVHFPGSSRTLNQPYAAVTSQRFNQVLQERLSAASGCLLHLGQSVEAIAAHSIRLADGQQLTANTVIDARGLDPKDLPDCIAFQKFVGLEVQLTSGPTPAIPVVMDARVSQAQGFHFLYVLPLAPNRLLVEDTLFSSNKVLDRGSMRQAALDYLEAASLEISEILREESGVLPMPWAGMVPQTQEGPIVAGLRGGWFHPGTGYSFPLALKLAVLIAENAPSPPSPPALAKICRDTARQQRFVHLLNRVFFRGVPPSDQWRVMQRFYRLPEDVIARYYALDMTLADEFRILRHGNPWKELIGWRKWKADAHGD